MDATEGDSTETNDMITEDTVPPTRSTDLWFSDGSVILQAENTQFKVHTSVLARHSVVFADLFQVPQPRDEPVIEGCPVVHLQDSAQDINHMLMSLYDQCKYPVNVPLAFSVIAAMVRMGVKYDIKAFRDQAVGRLAGEIASGRDALEDAKSHLSHRYIVNEPNLPYKIFGLAHEYRIQTVLPMAYLMCNMTSLDILLQEQNTQVMSREALKTCLLGRDALLRCFEEAFEWVYDIGSSDVCVGRRRCKEAGADTLSALWIPKPDFENLVKPFDTFKEDLRLRSTSIDFEDDLCSICSCAVENAFEESRHVFWRVRLPRCFGLPTWDKLTNFDEAA